MPHRILSRVALVGVATGGMSVAALPVAVSAVAGCPPDTWRVVKQVGVFYRSTGTAAGKYNGSTVKSTLSISLSLTQARSSAWEVSGGASVDFGIASVEAATSYTVTKTTTINKTVTDTVVVPSHYYGYSQPKAEYRTYHIYNEQQTPTCGTRVSYDYGYFDAITASPFFSECVATSPCTPKP